MLLQILLLVLALFFIRYLVLKYCVPYLPPRLSMRTLHGNPDKLDFGPNFTFESASSAWQVEKDVHPSNWSIFEKNLRKDGTPCCPPHLDACDAINQFDNDLQIMVDMNLKAYRFGVSWSALNPEEDIFDSKYL